MNHIEKLLRLFSTLLLMFNGTVFAQSGVEKDPFLQVLKSELERNYQLLQAHDPLFSSLYYRVSENNYHELSASSGVVTSSNHNTLRLLEISVSIGDDEPNRAKAIRIPLNEDETFATLKNILWRETESLYQYALYCYYQGQYDQKKPHREHSAQHFDYQNYYEDIQTSEFDQSLWEGRLRRISAPFADEKDVFDDKVVMTYNPQRIYFVYQNEGNTESFYRVENKQAGSCQFSFDLEGIKENKLVSFSKQLEANFPEELPEEYSLIDSSKIFIHNLLEGKSQKTIEGHTPPILGRPMGADMVGEKEMFKNIAWNAMQEEMFVNLNTLQKENSGLPYFISYTVTDAEVTKIESSLGATIYSNQYPKRYLNTTVLTGDDQFNNQHYGQYYSRSGLITELATENSYMDLRRNIWKSTNEAYTSALRDYNLKKAALAQQRLEDPAALLPDRVPPTPHEYQPTNDPSQQIEHHHLGDLENIVQNISIVFRDYPHVVTSGANLCQYQAQILYLGSDGMKYEQPFQVLGIKVYASLLASSGELLYDFFTIYVHSVNELPEPEQMIAKATALAKRLEKCYSTPPIEEDYFGPVMFTEDAVAEILSQALLNRNNGILDHRNPIIASFFQGKTKPIPDSQNKLVKKIGKRVMDSELTLYASDGKQYDPYYNPIFGYYPVDAEGVKPPYQLPLIEKGILKNMLSNSSSTTTSDSSNGHSRWAIANDRLISILSPGVLELQGSKSLPYDKLKRKLLSLAKASHNDYAYIVKKTASLNYLNDIPTLFQYQHRFSSAASSALALIRVSVKDGSEKVIPAANITDNIGLKNFDQMGGYSTERTIINLMLPEYLPEEMIYIDTDINRFAYKLSGVSCTFMIPKYIILNNIHIEKCEDSIIEKEPILPNPLQK